MKKNWMKKAMAVAISLILVLGLVPITAFADGTTENSETTVTFTAISGTAGAALDEGYEALLDGKYTEDNWSKWCVSGTQAYIIFEASEACSVNGYSFVTGNDTSSNAGRNPSSWTLYGCNSSEAGEDSDDWVAIHSVTDDETLQDVNYTKYDFAVSGQTTEYKYFMLKITAVQSGSVMQLAELILDVTTCEHNPTDAGTVVPPTCTEKGYTLLHCSACDYDYKTEFTEANGHSFGEGNLCTSCGYVICGDFMLKGGVFGTDYTYENNVLKIITNTSVTILGTTTTDRIEIASGVSAKVTLAGVNIDVSSQRYTAAFKIADDSTGEVTITLADGTENILKSGYGCAGLQKNGTYVSETQGSLTICEGELGTGSLKAIGGYYAAGIGGGDEGAGSNITVIGGTVTATGGYYAAGIGGGDYGAGSNISITGGTVTATGGDYAAGIGGGDYGAGSNISITGGTVTATGGYAGAGIGGGAEGAGSNISIIGGTVTATGGYYAAGIGGGDYGGAGSSISITGGTVTATGGDYAAGIGGGSEGAGSNISITGGTVTATGGVYGAGIGGGSEGVGSSISIAGGSVKAVAGVDANIIGGGYEYEAVIPTDGSEAANSVYLIELAVDGLSTVVINDKYYPVGHGKENKLYVYLPAASADEPNVVLLGEDRISGYYYVTDAQWKTSGYSVIYKADGKVVSAQLLQLGEDATAPAVPEKTGFVGKWDADGKNVTEDMTINAVYTEIPVVNLDDVKAEDKTELEDTKEQLEEMLKDDGYTENDKQKIQDAIDRIDAALAGVNNSETNSEDASETDSEDSSETNSEDGSKTDSEDTSETDSEDSSETNSEDGSETDSEDDSETDSETNSNDAPADKDEGLGTGAIVAIVIGSVAVAGIGGFALLWFVIKKKSWADLVAMFKK